MMGLGSSNAIRPATARARMDIERGPGMTRALVREFIRPAVRAVPSSMARRLGYCRISLRAEAEAGVTSQWTITKSGLKVSVATTGFEEHEVAI